MHACKQTRQVKDNWMAEVANLWDGEHAVSATSDMLHRMASVLNTDFGGYKCAFLPRCSRVCVVRGVTRRERRPTLHS